MTTIKNLLLIALVVYGTLCDSADVKDGMGCKKSGDYEYCEGKGSSYASAATDVQRQPESDGLLTRSSSGTSSLSKGASYGYNPPSACDLHDDDHCKQLNVIIKPTMLKNAQGQYRYILQTTNIGQQLKIAICSDNKCGRNSACDQQYASVQLLGWDPSSKKARLTVDNYRIPSCCRCQRKRF